MYNKHRGLQMGLKTIKLRPEKAYITLQGILKVCDVISTGGMAKMFLQDNEVLVNGKLETRRGRKLFKGDLVKVCSLLIEIT